MFRGSLVALITPMTAEGDIDYSALDRLIEFHIEQGTDGLVIAGTTGEAASFTAAEREQFVRYCVDKVNGRLPLIVGTGTSSTRSTIELTTNAMRAGVDACLIACPPYVKPTQEGLFQHFSAVADAVAIPQILYNVPGRTACDLLPETVIRLANKPNIIGIKEATGEVNRARTIVAECGDKVRVYSGDDITACDLMLAGGLGVISVTANVAPKEMHDLCNAALAGDINLARAMHERLMPLHKSLFCESNPIPVKWAVAQLGFCEAGLRLPLTTLDSIYHEQVQQALMRSEVTSS